MNKGPPDEEPAVLMVPVSLKSRNSVVVRATLKSGGTHRFPRDEGSDDFPDVRAHTGSNVSEALSEFDLTMARIQTEARPDGRRRTVAKLVARPPQDFYKQGSRIGGDIKLS